MQIDKCGGELYVKVFLPEGARADLLSRYEQETFPSSVVLKPWIRIHPLDWQYGWTLRDLTGKTCGWKGNAFLFLLRSDFWTRPLYISHAGQTQELTEGKNEVTFTYIPTEAAYVGNPNCRYKGRAIDLEKVVGGMR